VNFRANGTALSVLQENHYYPFGMEMEGVGTVAVTQNKYRYNGKGGLLKVVSFIFALSLDHFIR
jgi:hypothetical protein